MNCWEFKKCGREADGLNAAELGICPAYPDHGRECATVAGTLCGGKARGSFAMKLSDCQQQCDFYLSKHYNRLRRFCTTAGTDPSGTGRAMPGEKAVHWDPMCRSLFDHMINGFAYCRIICDEDGVPVDGLIMDVNRAFERQTGLRRSKVLGRRASEVMPGIENDPFDWTGTFGRVALTGEPVEFEQFAVPLGKWYAVSAYSPAKGDFAVVFEDVSERRLTLEKLEESQALLLALVEGTSDAVFAKDYCGRYHLFGFSACDHRGG